MDVSAVYSKDSKTVFINVINRNEDKGIQTNIANTSGVFTGRAEVSLTTAADLQEEFSFAGKAGYMPVKESICIKTMDLIIPSPPAFIYAVKNQYPVK